MPLQKGSSQKVISQNIHELTAQYFDELSAKGNRPHKQIVAIALAEADRSKADGSRRASSKQPSGEHDFTKDEMPKMNW